MFQCAANFFPRIFRQFRLRVSQSSTRPRTLRRLHLDTLQDRINPSNLGFGFAVAADGSGTSASNATATDSLGNAYITGSFSGSVQFGPSTLVSQGGTDAFVAKYSPTGSLVWAADLGGANLEAIGFGIAVDGSGNVYSTGWFAGNGFNVDPNSSNHPLSAATTENAYVSKLSSSGNYVFGVGLGYGGGAEGAGIAVDGSGNVYTTGYFHGTCAFDPNGSSYKLTSNDGNGGQNGNNNAYVSELNSSGSYVFAVDLGLDGETQGTSIAVDGSGNVYTTGYFRGTNVNFDPNSSNHQISSSGNGNNYPNAYVSKLNALGRYAFAVDLGQGNFTGAGAGIAEGNAIAVDGSGNVYTTGYFSGTGAFDPNGRNHQLSNESSPASAYVSKLNSTGQYVFAVDLGNGGFTEGQNGGTAYGTGIAVDTAGNVYTSGYFQGTNLNFDPDPNGYDLLSSASSAGPSDPNAYVSKLTSSGQFVFGIALGSGGATYGRGIAVDGSGGVYITGGFNGTNVNFNPFGAMEFAGPSFCLVKLTQSPVKITTPSLPSGVEDTLYDSTISASGGTGADTFFISNGALPSGLSLNPSTGEISGIPSTWGTFTFTITVIDSAGDEASQSYVLAITYASQYAGLAYSYTYAAYINAFDAYATGTGSYNAFLYAFLADYYASYASSYATAGDAAGTEFFAYYAYYYGYFGEYYALQDYILSGGASIYSYDAYYYGFYGYVYSYYTAAGY